MVNSLWPAERDDLFIWTCRAHVSGSWADQWICCTQSAMTGFTAKISNGNCQIVELGEEKHVCLLLTAASIKNKQWKKGNWLRVILLLSILYSFYHGKITCNIRLYLQFHFYKMSLQDFFTRFTNLRLEHTRTDTSTHIQTKLCNTHINKYRHSLTAPRQIFLQPRTCTIHHFHTSYNFINKHNILLPI